MLSSNYSVLLKRGRIAIALLLTLSTVFVAVGQQSQVYVTTQRFEHGLMIWRADNKTIYVLADDGQALTYGVTDYGHLPDNPIKPASADTIRPIFGFGQVWGNDANVRDLLGNPVLPEIGFETSVLVVNATIEIDELDGSTLQIKNDGSWLRLTLVPAAITPTPCANTLFFDDNPLDVCPSAPTTGEAAYQPFEHGFMIWLADSGDVWVFVDPPQPLAQAHWLDFAQSQYDGFADAASEQPPTNRLQPVGAFGRVWQNLAGWQRGVRQELGWATAPEQPYHATTQLFGRANHVHVYLSLPDASIVDAYSGLAGIFWSWVQ